MTIRLDRLATLYVAYPLSRLASKKQPSIPILMYHGIVDEDESGRRAYYRTTTSPSAFAAQMEHLYQSGYRTCSPSQAVALLKHNEEAATKSVALTFDDGYRDFYQSAFPVLNKYGFTATVYLPTSYIGDSTRQFKGRDCLSWSEVCELQKSGVSFGSHTMTHPQLHNFTKSQIELELMNSKKLIEDKTGAVVDSFAYPYAFPQADAEFMTMLRESLICAKYHSGVCTIVGTAGQTSDQLFMERLPINSFDDKALFSAKLIGAYDWISKPQRVINSVKRRASRMREQAIRACSAHR